jgi:hypothetical protein
MQKVMRRASPAISLQIRRRAPKGSINVPGAYRRISGYADDGEEETLVGYPGVICLVQPGLGSEHQDLLRRLFETVGMAQSEGAGSWTTVLQCFGEGSGAGAPVLATEELGMRSHAHRAGELLNLSNSVVVPVDVPIVINQLVPDQVSLKWKPFSRIRKECLLLFIGRKGKFCFAPELERSLYRQRKRIVVAEIDGDHLLLTFDKASDFLATANQVGSSGQTPNP